MYTQYTYQDWLSVPEEARPKLLEQIVRSYRSSPEFKAAAEAEEYFRADNTAVAGKVVLTVKKIRTRDASGKVRSAAAEDNVIGNRIRSNFLFRFVTQQNQFLLGNGVTLEDEELKARLGIGFDHQLQQAGEKALLHGVCWGYWNLDHLEILPAYSDALSGFVALLDERTSAPGVGIQFWQMAADRPMYIRLFEADGLTEYRQHKDGLRVTAPKRGYRQTWLRDGAGAQLIREDNYSALPIVPFYASGDGRGAMTPAIKTKIDLYDNILSDFGDNLDRANDVYWVLNNFGGTTDDIYTMLEEIRRIKAVANLSDGTGSSSTAEPRTIEVPYAARQTALQLLEKALYQDFMALNMDELTGGSLTTVAIKAAMINLNLKADRYEWQAFGFVQGVLRLLGVETEEIRFQRQELVNAGEVVQDVYTMRGDIDLRTALKLNPYISQDEIDGIVENLAAEQASGLPSMEDLQRTIDEAGGEP